MDSKRERASKLFGGPIRPEELEGDYVIRQGSVPGPELDALFLERIEGFPRKKMFMTEYSTDLYYIPSGKPRRTHMIDARPVPRFSRDDSVALAALERFAEERGVWWSIGRFTSRYGVTLHGDRMPVYGQSADTLAHAVILAILAAVNTGEQIDERY